MIELRPAWAWDCPECGVEMFSRAIVPEFSEEDLVELREEHGVESWETGHFTMAPNRVKCTECGREFDASVFGDGEHL